MTTKTTSLPTVCLPGWLLFGTIPWPKKGGGGQDKAEGRFLARMVSRKEQSALNAMFWLSPLSSVTSLERAEILGQNTMPRKSVYLISKKTSSLASEYRKWPGGTVNNQNTQNAAHTAQAPTDPIQVGEAAAEGLGIAGGGALTRLSNGLQCCSWGLRGHL